MRTSAFVVAIAALLALAVGAGLVATAEGEYDLTIEDAVETPEETIEIAGSEYEIDHIGVVDPGETIEVAVASDESYKLFLYNEKEQAEYNEEHSDSVTTVELGTEDDELDTSAIPAGTYMLSLELSGDGRQAVAPVVVQGYDVSLEYSATASIEDDITLTATVEPKKDLENPDHVEVAIWDGNDVTEITLEASDEETYEATMSAAELGVGEYDVYGSVMGDGEVENYQTALAVVDGGSLTVEEDDGTDDSDGGNGGDGSDDTNGQDESDDDGAPNGEDEEPEDTGTTDDDTSTDDDDRDKESDEVGPEGENGEESDESESTETENGEESDENESVLEPTDNETSDDSADDDDALGVGGLAVVGVALAVLTLGRLGPLRSQP